MITSIVILAVSLSLDALGVGLSYGLRRIKVPFISKLIICCFSIIYSGAALIAGKTLINILSPDISKLIGILILFLMGSWIILQSFLKSENNESSEVDLTLKKMTLLKIAIKSLGITIQIIKNPVEGDIDKSGVIDKNESLLLGLALSLDAIGVGIGSGLTGFHSMVIPFAVGLFQLIFLCGGLYFGEKFALVERMNKKILSLMPGVLLIFLALTRI